MNVEISQYMASHSMAELLKKLDDELFSILSVGEKIALEVLEKRNDGYNHLCDILIKDVFEKWQNIYLMPKLRKSKNIIHVFWKIMKISLN